VQTREGLVYIPKGATAYVMETGNDAAGYNLHDSLQTGVIKITVNKKVFTLSPGKELLLTTNSKMTFRHQILVMSQAIAWHQLVINIVIKQLVIGVILIGLCRITKTLNMIRVAIVGATGYVGQELVRLLIAHPQVQVSALVSKTYAGLEFSRVYPSFKNLVSITCMEEDLEKLASQVDLIFLALPHGMSAAKLNSELLQKVRFIDLGADFRLKNVDLYETWYQTKHSSPQLLSQAVYGLTEWHHDDIAGARLIANPGCYSTCTELSLLPLISADIIKNDTIIVDAKSGVSGAGRELVLGSHFNEINENIKAYKVAAHRHTPEIEQELSVVGKTPITITFTPHLIPMNRGILTTAYTSLKSSTSHDEIYAIFDSFYKNKPFIRLFQTGGEYPLPETRFVKGSNYCDIGFAIDKRNSRLIVVAAIDNLMKGAAGQAVQNMNILFGLDETTGLNNAPIFPG
jgi:N-acetyl-gamma-glutamyl-phosphate reductase